MSKKRKFKDTKVGSFLIGEKGLFTGLSEVLPDNGFLGVLKGLISKDNTLSPLDKERALKMLEMDKLELESVTARWQADLSSSSWLARNVRPLVLLYLIFMTTLIAILDSANIEFTVGAEWIELLKSSTITAMLAYFGSRGVEKYKAISNGKG